MTLPKSITDSAYGIPIAEDVGLGLLRDALPDMDFTPLISQDRVPPYVLIRADIFPARFGVDQRFQYEIYLTCESFTRGINADIEGIVILNAVTQALQRLATKNTPIYDGLGWLNEVEVIDLPARRSDWATSEGPVQYADLPQDYVRCISSYRLLIKRSQVGPHVYEN